MIRVHSKVKIDHTVITRLTSAQVTALEKTAEALHTEVVQAQVIPFDTGNLQNESTFVDYRNVRKGAVTLVSSTSYVRRLYFHPEYHFQKEENPNAKGKWLEEWCPGGGQEEFSRNAYKGFYRREVGL